MGTSKKRENQKLTSKVQYALPFLPLVVILFAWGIFSSPYFLKGLVPFSSTYLVSFFNPWTNYYGMPVKNAAMPDVITQLYPWKYITIDSLKNGALPTWNPYQFSGNPHLANVQSAVFTPFNLLFFILPFIDAWSLLILLQPLCAGLFMYVFLRSHKLSSYSITIGSISFMFCSFIVTWMAYGTLGYALLFLPLFLYGIERFITKADWIAISILILCPPLSIFSGHFQTSLYVLIVSVCYLFVRYISERKHKMIHMAIIYISIGVLIASLQVVPTYQFYSQSVRSESYIQNEVIPWNQLIRLLAPDFYGNPVTRNDWVGHYAEWGTYAGIVSFILAVLALFNAHKNTTVLFFTSVTISSILFAFQPHFISLLAWSKIPVISTSTPSRVVGIISFCIAVLSAFGLEYLLKDWAEKKLSRRLLITSLISIIVICGIWLFVFSMEGDFLSIAKRNFLLPTAIASLTIGIFFTGLLRIRNLTIVLPLLLIILSSFEMIRFSTKWMPFEVKEFVYPEVSPLTYLKNNANKDRVYGLIGNEVFGMFKLYGIEGYDPLYSRRYGEFISAADDGQIKQLARSAIVFPRTGKYAKQTLDMLGVRYILHSKGDGQGSWLFPFWKFPNNFTLVFSDDKYEIHKNNSAFPRTYLVNSYKKIVNDQQIVDEIFSGSTNIRETVILEEDPNNAEKLDNCNVTNPATSAVLEKYEPTEIQIRTISVCSSLVVVSDVYYPGWVAYVDDHKVPIYRANYAFRAIPVSEGEHIVTLKYENWYL